jgi:hypothetical protein
MQPVVIAPPDYCSINSSNRLRMSASPSGPVYELDTFPPGSTKNDVGMYRNSNDFASSSPDGVPVMAETNATLSRYSGMTFSATAEISTHDCQLSE